MASALVMLLLSAVTTLAAAQQRNSSIINLGSSLTPRANSSWVSPSGIFAFGFYQQPQNNDYAICIFFTSSSERMVVWTAESYSPYVPDSAILLLTNDGRLILQDKGSQYIYFEISSIFQTVAWASMLDNGNFVLYNSDGRAIWQSFDEPTDTLLPGQRLSPGAQLLSKASETNVTGGIFRLKMQTDGNLVQYPADSPDTYDYAYYSSNTGGGGAYNNVSLNLENDAYNNVSLNLENDGRLYLSTGTSVLLNLTKGLGERYGVGRTTYLMRIDADGVFRLYSKGSTWRSIWSSTEDKCAPKGVCGQNSFCTYLDGVADCKCLPGFDFVQSGDRTAGCARNFVLESCTDKNLSAKYETRRVPNVNWEENSYATEISHSEEDCRRACLGDCYCDAAFFRDGQCRKQRLPLRYGRRLPIYSDIALVKFVAVKVLIETSNNAEDFINEVASISRTSHVNIVNLLGFCYERKRRALVYEFMPNKSLDKFIYKSGSDDAECSLDWEKLYEIAIGIAQGLDYLHRGCNTRIVHFNIKPQNILLDEDFCPKISDFGLAKLVKKKQSKISMLGARGTIGYIAPEVFSRNFGAVSHKSDVYSYGMMLLEMGEARRFAETEVTQSSDNYFPDKIYEHVLLNSGDVLIEEREETKRKMLLIGLWCIKTAPSDRPSMTKVVEMLEGSLHSIQIPPKPFLHSPNLSEQQFSSSFPSAQMHTVTTLLKLPPFVLAESEATKHCLKLYRGDTFLTCCASF